jgi:hypothetical protein
MRGEWRRHADDDGVRVTNDRKIIENWTCTASPGTRHLDRRPGRSIVIVRRDRRYAVLRLDIQSVR